MATFLLIHGAWHGAWCWREAMEELTAGGARVLAPDLPAMGDDVTPPGIITLDYWARFVAELAASASEPVVLVAHSRGGIVASQAAELVPERIRRLVYVAAYLLPSRATLAAEARRDVESLIPPNMIPASSGLTCTVRPEVIREAFYGRCSDEDAELARTRLSPEPLKPLVTPLDLTPGRYGRIPRSYVRTAFDRVITPAAQARMLEALPCESVCTLETDHSPFLSQPEALARTLISI